MTAFAQAHAITDICFFVADVEKAAAFYVDRLGFQLRRRAEGFADFKGAGTTLALWQLDHVAAHTGISSLPAQPRTHKACAAMELASPAGVDDAYRELSTAGVAFQGPPGDYPWNARCCYFYDLDDNVWELYAWHDGGPVGDVTAPA